MSVQKDATFFVAVDHIKHIQGIAFFCIYPPPGLLPVLGPLERYMMPTLDLALLMSSRAGADLGRTLDRLRLSFVCLDVIIEPLLYISDTHLGRVV